MKKIFISAALFCSSFFLAQNYWEKLPNQMGKNSEDKYYKLNISVLKQKLNTGLNSKNSHIIIEIPNIKGEMEKFKVKSFSVMDEKLASQYQLGSYTGVSLSDPHRTIRFSISPNDFQSMILDHGEYQFIDPDRTRKGVYRVHPKTNKTESGKVFECKTNENHKAVKQINQLFSKAKKQQSKSLAKLRTPDDKKYRTLRIAISTTGEYTSVFGGRAGALAQINATLTRVNAVYERDLALHFNLVNAPDLVYTDATNDPYSDAADGTTGTWSWELQKTLTKELGEANYDIGHLLGASGGGGNAGCLGCICVSPKLDANGVPIDDFNSRGKGSAYTSPAVDNQPYGDAFDIDFVAHEIGHQLGANHTFSHQIEGTDTQVEPGSGSTIMGYAGLTSANVQMKSDPYFSIASLNQMQLNLESKICDHETALVNNTPPTIEALTNYTIPKGTPFILTAKATDKENDALTYTWEQTDSATDEIREVTGDNLTGANFRSLPPSTNSTRYFPRLESVIAGNLIDRTNWEAVSNVARTMNFAVTVRDNNAISTQQQVSTAEQVITVGNDGPFEVTNTKLYYNASRPITWDIANTDKAPYNVKNVKIDYTTDSGKTWNLLAASTSNDGSELLTFPTSLNEKEVQIRITALDNVFYTVSQPIRITKIATCTDAPTPVNFVAEVDGKNVNLSWDEILNSTYTVRYRLKNTTQWTEVKNISTNTYTIVDNSLLPDKIYEVQIASNCNGTEHFTNSKEFSFPSLSYCKLEAKDSSFEYISRVKITDASGNIILDNPSKGDKGYSEFLNDSSKLIVLKQGSKGNKLNITIAYPKDEDFYETLSAWIDFDGDGNLSEAERIVTQFVPDPSDGNVGTKEVQLTFDVPSDAKVDEEFLRLRIALKVGPTINSVPAGACDGNLRGTFGVRNTYKYGEVEDYRVKITK